MTEPPLRRALARTHQSINASERGAGAGRGRFYPVPFTHEPPLKKEITTPEQTSTPTPAQSRPAENVVLSTRCLGLLLSSDSLSSECCNCLTRPHAEPEPLVVLARASRRAIRHAMAQAQAGAGQRCGDAVCPPRPVQFAARSGPDGQDLRGRPKAHSGGLTKSRGVRMVSGRELC